MPPRSHSVQETFPSQSRSRHASGTSPSRASWTARTALSANSSTGPPRMISATARDFTPGALVLDPVVRRFLRHLHVVHVALAQAGGGDADEPRLGPQLVDAAATGVTHAAPQPAHQLEHVHRQGTLVRDAPFDALGDELQVLRLLLEVPVLGALPHRAERPHP